MILLVEDDALSRRAFGQLLRAKGYQVVEAGDGHEALKLLHDWVFELVITDVVLPHLHGLNLVNFIRARWPRLPIVVISGYLSQDAGEVILDGSAHFIQKPIRTDRLIETVQRLVPNPN